MKAGLMILALMGLSACATLEKWTEGNREHREFQVDKAWVRFAPAEPNEGYRKIERMTPVMAGRVLLTGNALDGVVAWDRETGQELWRVKTINGVEGGAALIRDRLFFGASDGQFYSVDVRNGRVLWTFPTNAETLSEPLLDSERGVVYVLTSANVVHALEADSGRPLWVYSRTDTNNFSVRGGTKPALKGDNLYVGFSDGFFTALSAKTGQVRWEVQLNRNKRFRDVDTTPVIDGDRLYVAGYDDRLYCLSVEKGDVLWKIDQGGYAGLTLLGTRVYYPTSGGEVLALDRENGQVLWTYKIPEDKGIATSIVPFKGLLVFGESRGLLRFVDAGTGRPVAHFEPGRGVFSTPSVDEKNGSVYFISNEANVYALKAGWVSTSGLSYLR
ncbi:MAG: PQQ-binding-like beta-propeller repeat protein [Bdellovibrionaceae bacterium]|nr:PQQ-binding-like beta-propeller repeat protein [Pseudobdellovibrionaceae bacterium]MBX3034336.1 PQQ-binding-like beta-propeller repeat protein [Pseudobdellovibrionaceae bacterium]